MEEKPQNTEVTAEEEKPATETAPVLMRLVGVQFSSAGKIHSFSAGNFELRLHDLIVVEGEKGQVVGRVITPVYEKEAKEVPTNIKKVLRKAVKEDIDRFEKNREEAMAAHKLCQKKIAEHILPMKLIDVDILTGDAKAIFYFTADERVDFRALVKDLANALHKRIEMRQIGARDAAKNVGSLASCGLVCCCEQHLREFRSISIQMAKNQGLSPNPIKLTGMCGKLKCCLQYENDLYTEMKKDVPPVGSDVETPKGRGRVRNTDPLRGFVTVSVEGEEKEMRFKVAEVTRVAKRPKVAKVEGQEGETAEAPSNEKPQRRDSRKSDGRRGDSRRPDARRTDGKKPDARKPNDRRPSRPRSDRPRPERPEPKKG